MFTVVAVVASETVFLDVYWTSKSSSSTTPTVVAVHSTSSAGNKSTHYYSTAGTHRLQDDGPNKRSFFKSIILAVDRRSCCYYWKIATGRSGRYIIGKMVEHQIFILFKQLQHFEGRIAKQQSYLF